VKLETKIKSGWKNDFNWSNWFMIVFITQVVIFPLQIVDVGRIDGLDRGLLRFRIERVGFLMLAGFFLSLNRFLIYRYILMLFSIFCLADFMLGFQNITSNGIVTSYILKALRKNQQLYFVVNPMVILIGLYNILTYVELL
jgi:hypothetical protein